MKILNALFMFTLFPVLHAVESMDATVVIGKDISRLKEWSLSSMLEKGQNRSIELDRSALFKTKQLIAKHAEKHDKDNIVGLSTNHMKIGIINSLISYVNSIDSKYIESVQQVMNESASSLTLTKLKLLKNYATNIYQTTFYRNIKVGVDNELTRIKKRFYMDSCSNSESELLNKYECNLNESISKYYFNIKDRVENYIHKLQVD